MSDDIQEDERLTPRERELLERGRRYELLEEIRAVVRAEMQDQFRQHFGDRSPEQVLEVMRSAERIHRRIDRLAESFWGSAAAVALKWGLIVLLAAQLVINSGSLSKFLPFGGGS